MMEFDFHGHYPHDIVDGGILFRIVQQAWEMGETELSFIHGHGRNRGISPGFINTNTGRFGLRVRVEIRNCPDFGAYIVKRSLDCRDPGTTRVRLRKNLNPSREEISSDLSSF
jgi:hypothetical protein